MATKTKGYQFTISAEKSGHMIGKRKKKGTINQFTDDERQAFESHRSENESTWSRIDSATIDKQCETKEVWDD